MDSKQKEVLRFDDLSPYLLLKNGNYLYKIPFRGGFAVLKVYYGTRRLPEYIAKSLGNVLINNQTSFMPLARWKTEYEALNLWRQAGFRVFDTYDDVVVEGCVPDKGWRLFEYVDRPRFVNYFADQKVPLPERLDMWKRFLPVWHRRHQLAIERREPRLIHENGDLKHVMIMEDGRFLFFDFEMVYRSRRKVKDLVAREILAYLKSLGNTVGKENWDLFLEATLAAYPDRDLLQHAHTVIFRNPNPLVRTARMLDWKFSAKANKPCSKYNTALKLHRLLHP
jgi:hypothetical protein